MNLRFNKMHVRQDRKFQAQRALAVLVQDASMRGAVVKCARDKVRDTDSDYAMRKPSRCWLGAVPRYWNVVTSCFPFISFAENTSAALAPRAGISQPILLLFFCFLALEFVYKTVPQISFIRSKTLVAFERRQAIFQRLQIFNQLPVRILNF